jgi:hypothetical protein
MNWDVRRRIIIVMRMSEGVRGWEIAGVVEFFAWVEVQKDMFGEWFV